MALTNFKAFVRCNYTGSLAMRQSALKYRIAGSGTIGAAAAAAASANLPSSGPAPLTAVEAAALAIYAAAIAAGFSDAQAQAIATAAALAYAAAINQGLSTAQAQQAAATAATQLALQDVGASMGADWITYMIDDTTYAAIFGGVLAQVPTSAQGAAQDALVAYLVSIGL